MLGNPPASARLAVVRGAELLPQRVQVCPLHQYGEHGKLAYMILPGTGRYRRVVDRVESDLARPRPLR